MRYFLIRFGRFLIVFFIVTFGVMVLLRIGLNAPGDPARTMLGGTASQAADRRGHRRATTSTRTCSSSTSGG